MVNAPETAPHRRMYARVHKQKQRAGCENKGDRCKEAMLRIIVGIIPRNGIRKLSTRDEFTNYQKQYGWMGFRQNAGNSGQPCSCGDP
jgi:hypothetical protein